MFPISGLNSRITNATELADAYYSSKDTIYEADACHYNNTTFIKEYRVRFPDLIDKILFVNLFFINGEQRATGTNRQFYCHVFLMIWDTDQYYVLDYDVQRVLSHLQPKVAIPAKDYLARILNTDLTVNHLKNLLENTDKKSEMLPLFRVFSVDEWNTFYHARGSSVWGLHFEYNKKINEENNKVYNPDLIPSLNFYEFMEFLKETSPNVDNLKKTYDNATIKNEEKVLSNARLTTVQIQDFLKLLENYPLFNHATKRIISVEEQRNPIVKQEAPVKQADPNSKNEDGNTALLLAVERNDVESISKLLKNPDVNVLAKNNRGFNALMLAINTNNIPVVRTLLESQKFDSSMRIKHKINALSLAREVNNPEMLSIITGFMQISDERYQKESLAARLLNVVDEIDKIIRFAKSLYPKIYNWNRERENLQNHPNDINAYQALLQKLTNKDVNGWCLIQKRPENSGAEFYDLLMQLPGVDINVQTEMGLTLLMLNSVSDYRAIVRYLLGMPGINVGILNESGDNALIWAVKQSSIGVIEELLQVPEVGIFAKNKDNLSALDIAIQKKANGLHPNPEQLEKGSYPYNLAMEYREKHNKICELIENRLKVLQNQNNSNSFFFVSPITDSSFKKIKMNHSLPLSVYPWSGTHEL